MSLARFHQAQVSDYAGYANALAEIRTGGKRSHWIWYIFPQLDGLGSSSAARTYALRDLDEAVAYLQDPVLRVRYAEICGAVEDQLSGGIPVEELMNGPTDARKLISSVTLFRIAATRLAERSPDSEFVKVAQRCGAILEHSTAQGYGPCRFTLERCEGSPPR
jgi:uncharacterized protein (DUF1810 family)